MPLYSGCMAVRQPNLPIASMSTRWIIVIDGDGLRGAQHTELEFVTGKGQGRGAVAVSGVLWYLRQDVY